VGAKGNRRKRGEHGEERRKKKKRLKEGLEVWLVNLKGGESIPEAKTKQI